MPIDFIIVAPFIATVLQARRTFVALLFVAAATTVELSSNLPFGVSAAILGLALTTTRLMLDALDASSAFSRTLSFLVGITILDIFVVGLRFASAEVWNMEHIIRGPIFFIRTFSTAIILTMTLFGALYALRLIRNAFVEEKIL